MFLCLLFRIAGDIGIELRYQRRSTNRRRNITYWSCFYPSCNPDFSSFLLGGLHLPLQDLLQSPLLRLTTTAYTVALGLYFLSTGQVHKAAATTANHFLLRRLITPQWKLLLINFRFIPSVVELRKKDFVCFSTFRPDTNFGKRCHCKRFWGVPPKSNGCGHQTVNSVGSLGGRSIRVKQPR